ncbi:MAG: T9SS type A sorting domain-containing protein [Bacteroidia bacterium]
MSGGMVTTLAGNGSAGYLNDSGQQAMMDRPRAAWMDAAGTSIYVADGGNHVLRRILLDPMTAISPAASVLSGLAFPNPAFDQVAFQVAGAVGTDAMQLSVIDLTGAVVMEPRPYVAEESISIEGLAPGLYFARIQTGTGMYVSRFVKH